MSVAVTLVFRNQEERDFFMGGLSDGFGENECSLAWEGDFDKATLFQVDPTTSEDWEHHVEVQSWLKGGGGDPDV